DWWTTYTVSPVGNGITYAVFKVLGVNHGTLRLAPAILGCLSVAFLFWLAFRYAGPRAALFALLFSGVNVGLVAYARLAMLESFLLFFQTWLYVLCARWLFTRRGAFWIGVLFVAAFGAKASAILFLIPLALVLFLFSAADRSVGRSGSVKGFVLGGGAASFLYLLFAAVNWPFFYHLNMGFSAHKTILDRSSGLLKVLELPTGNGELLLTLMPPLLWAAWLGMGRLWNGEGLSALWESAGPPRQRIRGALERIARLDPFPRWALFCVLVFIGDLLVHLFLRMDVSARRLLHMLPPMILTASLGLDRWLSGEGRPSRGGFFGVFSAFLVGWVAVKATVFCFFGVSGWSNPATFLFTRPFPVFRTPGDQSLFLGRGWFEMGYALVFAGAWLLWKYRRARPGSAPERTEGLPGGRWKPVVAWTVAVVYLGHQLSMVLPPLLKPTYLYRDASRAIERFSERPGAVVLGNMAAGLPWEGSYYPLYYMMSAGIGYKKKTMEDMGRIVDKYRPTLMVVFDPDGKVGDGALYDWSSPDAVDEETRRTMEKHSPRIFDFREIVYRWKGLEGLYPRGQWLLLKRKISEPASRLKK
ncbi:MAG TPA: glycosyltransferase family 39 protein, partial [Elusimicrobiota bacterium]|nr:glycosyltransferase family 39 protein [Elusimicrobiota bacterium]